MDGYYPSKSYIWLCFKAQIVADISGHEISIYVVAMDKPSLQDFSPQVNLLDPKFVKREFDEELYLSLVKNIKKSWNELYQPCDNPSQARRIEKQAIAALISDYRKIIKSREDPAIASLNELLSP